MFYQGDLQSGISLAIQQQKLVACLVRQEGDDLSQLWEDEWLKASVDESEATLGDKLSENAVVLRLDAGTQEAGFLSAFCSLEKIPKLIIIKQGLVLEDIDSNTPEDEFKKRILSRCHTPQAGTAPGSTATIDVSQIVPESIQRAIEPEDTTAAAPPLSEVQQAADATAQPNSPTLQDILSERNARLDADHRKKREEEREAKKAAAKRAGKQREDQAAEASSVPQARQDWITQQRNRQQEARVEKERVLRAIESDKAARREREQRRRIAQSADTPAAFAPQKSDSTHGRSNPTCNLQIRLFDGSSLRSKFDSSATLATSVRTYISEQSSSDMPYNFREIRTPQPSRTIEISEENESLQSLGLTPSATLVLVPVKGYTDAYASSGAGGILSKGLNTGYGLLSGAVGFVGSAVGSVLGYGGDATLEGPYMGGTSDDLEPSNMDDGTKTTQKVTPVTAGPSSGIKIRTLADQRKEEEEEEDDGQELYNGNQLNFEPRTKEDDGAADDKQ